MKKIVEGVLTIALSAQCMSLLGDAAPAQAGPSPSPAPQYMLIDVGTFGGPNAELNGPAEPITRRGSILGLADTTIPDDDYPNVNPFFGDPKPLLVHAFAWHEGQLTDLGALPGNNSSAVFEVNSRGVGAGMSETGELDPLNGYPAAHAVLFKNSKVIDLGTLPGGTGSQAIAINNRGQAAGFGNNNVPDPFSMLPYTTQARSFIWQNGVMHDLGTLGGPDAVTVTLNERGQIAGDSYTNSTPNLSTGVPTSHPFLWTNGHMRDLGTLGGTQTQTSWLNNRGDVVGFSRLAGDQTAHPYLWDGQQMRDLGTLGGDFGMAWHVNDAGAVVGWSSTTGNSRAHAFLWEHETMTDLFGAGSTQCGFAYSVNSRDQIVGETCDHSALLWSGGIQYDLNSLVGPTDIHLTESSYITDRGEIASLGTLPNGDQHVFLLTPRNGH